MRKDLVELQKKIDEVSKPHVLLQGRPESHSLYETRMIHLRNLQNKLQRRKRQVPFGENTFLELEDSKLPNIIHRILHGLPGLFKVHHWIDADHELWGALRICPLCGLSEWTIYPREFNDWKYAPVHYDAEDMMNFIKEFKNGDQ